jgi:hypothetical protein
MRRGLVTVALVLVAAVAFAQPPGRGAVGRGDVQPVIEKVKPQAKAADVRTVEDLDAQIAALDAQIAPLVTQLAPLQAQQRALRSRKALTMRAAAPDGYRLVKDPATGKYDLTAVPDREAARAAWAAERAARRIGRGGQ